MRKHRCFTVIISLISVLVIVSCVNRTSKTKSKEEIKQELISGLEKNRASLPMKAPHSNVWITNMELKDDIITYTCELSIEEWKIMAMPKEEANSDKNIARVIELIEPQFIELLVANEVGIKYIYLDNETKEEFLVLSINPQRLSKVKKMLDNGEIESYTIMELFKIEVDNFDLPTQLDDGLWLTDAYISDKNIFYVITFDEELNESDIDFSAMPEIKSNIISGLKEIPLWLEKKEIIEEQIYIIYIYRDSRGKELFRVEITPTDILEN